MEWLENEEILHIFVMAWYELLKIEKLFQDIEKI